MAKKQPILDELHAVREQLLADCGGTLAGLVARLQAEQATSGRTILKAQQAEKSGESEMEHQSSPTASKSSGPAEYPPCTNPLR